jgi:hypothetical protein
MDDDGSARRSAREVVLTRVAGEADANSPTPFFAAPFAAAAAVVARRAS